MRKLVRRLGCGVALVLWFTLLLTPCMVIFLFERGEFTLAYSDLPKDGLKIWLVQERQISALAIANSWRATGPGATTCTIIDTNFLVWRGSAEKYGAVPARECACYKREADRWQSVSAGPEACTSAGVAPQR